MGVKWSGGGGCQMMSCCSSLDIATLAWLLPSREIIHVDSTVQSPYSNCCNTQAPSVCRILVRSLYTQPLTCTVKLIQWPYSSSVLRKDKVQLQEWEGRENEGVGEKRVVFADLILTTGPGKSLSLEPFRNSNVVYTGGEWVKQDMHRACILQHLIMNTRTHAACRVTHTHIHALFFSRSKVGLEFCFFFPDTHKECIILSAAASSSLWVWIS